MTAPYAASAGARLERPVFFAHIRASGVFGPSLSQTEVDGLDGILDGWEEIGWPSDLRWVAYTIATAWHEARLNAGIREIGRGAGKAYGRRAGPYGHVYYGRGPCQLTWLDNYAKFSKLVGVDFVKDPDLVLEPKTGAAILIIGSRDGMFRAGKKLSRYFSATADDPVGARDIINGDVAKNGPRIAGYHRTVLGALKASMMPVPLPMLDPTKPVAERIEATRPSAAERIDRIDPLPSASPPPPASAKPRGWFGAVLDRLRTAYPPKKG